MAIVGLVGAKQSGKDTAAKLITGLIMAKVGLISKFDMNEAGDLLVTYEQHNNKGMSIQTDVFDLDRRDGAFMGYLAEMIWPHVKIYHFADSLKFILANMFNLSIDNMFGDDTAKNEPTTITWGQFNGILPKTKQNNKAKPDDVMTYREVMQKFGDVIRHIDDTAFTRYTMQEIDRDACPISIVADVRRQEEVDIIKQAGGIVIYFTKTIDDTGTHDTEQAGKIDRANFDIIIDNQNMTLAQKNVALLNELKNTSLFA